MNPFSPVFVYLLVALILNAETLLRAQDDAGSIDKSLARVVKNMVEERPNVINAVATVDFGNRSWSGAFGLADPNSNTKMTPDHQFRTASVAKTFTGVLVLQLIEKGELRLDDHVGDLLESQLGSLKRSPKKLQITDGKELGHQVTVRQLLTHTSGIPDYFFEKSLAGHQKGRSFVDVWSAFGTPESRKLIDRRWEPCELLRYYFDNELASHAKFQPGKGFHYSDTNYLLLGLVIEEKTGKPLAENVRTRILEPLA